MPAVAAVTITRASAARRAIVALSIEGVAGIFVSMTRVVMVVLAVLAFALLTWVTGLLGDVLAGWAPAILSVTGGWGFFGGLTVLIVAGYTYVFWYQRRHDRQVYVATGVIEAEKPHPWPMWLRVLPFVLPALGIVAAVIAASRGI